MFSFGLGFFVGGVCGVFFGKGEQHCSSRHSPLKRTKERFGLFVLYDYRHAGLQSFTRVCSAVWLQKEKQEDSHHFLEALVNGRLLITCQAGPCLCLRLPPGRCAGEAAAGFPAVPPADPAPRTHFQRCRARGGDAASAVVAACGELGASHQFHPSLLVCLFLDCPCRGPSAFSPASTVQVPQCPAAPCAPVRRTLQRKGKSPQSGKSQQGRSLPPAGSSRRPGRLSPQRPGCLCPGPTLKPRRGHLRGSLDEPWGGGDHAPAEQRARISGLTDFCHLSSLFNERMCSRQPRFLPHLLCSSSSVSARREGWGKGAVSLAG